MVISTKDQIVFFHIHQCGAACLKGDGIGGLAGVADCAGRTLGLNILEITDSFAISVIEIIANTA